MAMLPMEDLPPMDFDRSNKGASKQRRDQINAEIAVMRDLLPLPESSRQRLSQLQVMSLTCVYIRKCNVLQNLFQCTSRGNELPEATDFFQALTGFLLVTTRDGKLLYISENVTDYLGHSMVDMKTQGDSLYDIVDKKDHAIIQAQLSPGTPLQDPDADVSFFCRMNMSRTLKRQPGFGDVKVMHVRGHFVNMGDTDTGYPSDSRSVFMAVCSPLITPEVKENLVQNNTMVFKTVHNLDMTFLEVSKNGEYHLGCTADDLNQRSWYSFLHPEDILVAKEKHAQLVRSNHELGCMLTVRMLKLDGSSFWVNTAMHLRQACLTQNEEPHIVCINQVIDEHEAYQVQGHMFSLYPSRTHELWGSHLSAVSSPNIDSVGCQWMPQQVLNSVPNYLSNVPRYIEHTPCPDTFTSVMESSHKPVADCHFQSPSSIVQLNQLKVMLKRKIQGSQLKPSVPAKLARTNWATDGFIEGPVFSDFNQGASQKEFYSQAAVPSYADCQGQMMPVLQSVYIANKASFKEPTYVGMLKKADEQVVPESYLTPDPSPVSSPEPSQGSMKTDVMNRETKITQERFSNNILQALEKLAAQPHMTTEIKVTVSKEKELPILDAFDIDTFFEAVSGEFQSKTSQVMEAKIKCEIKKELPPEPNIPNFAALKDEALSPLPCDSDQNLNNVLMQHPPQSFIPPQIKPLFQSEVQHQKQPPFQSQFQGHIQSSESQIQPALLPSSQAQIHPQIQPSSQAHIHPALSHAKIHPASSRAKIHPHIQSSSQAQILPQIQPSSQAQIHPQIQPSSQAQIHPQIQPSSQAQIHPQIQPSSQAQIHPQIQPSSQAQIHPQIQPSFQLQIPPHMQSSCQAKTQPQTQTSFFPRRQSPSESETQPEIKLTERCIPLSPEASIMSFPDNDFHAEVSEFHLEACDYMKDMTVPISRSVASQKTIDDLMSYLSEDSLDQMKADKKSSPRDDTQDVGSEKTYLKSFYMENSTCNKLLQTATRLPEEFSPQSSTSTLENDLFDEGPDFPFEMGLNLPGNQNEMPFMNNSVLGMYDDLRLDFILNSFTPTRDSLEMMKHSQ